MPTIERIVAENAKQRFALATEADVDGKEVVLIRANQGHSVTVRSTSTPSQEGIDVGPFEGRGAATGAADDRRANARRCTRDGPSSLGLHRSVLPAPSTPFRADTSARQRKEG